MIRLVTENDARRLLEIYAHYVEKTAITFEYDVPTEEEFRGRIRTTLEDYPYFAAIRGCEIVGYAYAGRFHQRRAYDHAAEVSVYVAENSRGQGIGRELYTALELALKMQNVVNLYACIACIDKADEYLSNNSIGFHKHMGYRLAGEFHGCGYKFGRWYDMAYMEKFLSAHSDMPAPFVPFPQVEDGFGHNYSTECTRREII